MQKHCKQNPANLFIKKNNHVQFLGFFKGKEYRAEDGEDNKATLTLDMCEILNNFG